ncbi:hypothetical protein LTR39_005509 [Cryomyces antarcticus]|nr:hypothetical protein LTR39_005509 [Cryomyces antarcticus]
MSYLHQTSDIPIVRPLDTLIALVSRALYFPHVVATHKVEPRPPKTYTSREMATQTASAYVQSGFAEPVAAQHNFVQQLDLDNPDQAMATYARIMHQHTKHQYDMAASSARRRSNAPSSGIATLAHD